MNERTNDPKFQLAAALLVDALSDPEKTCRDIWGASWPVIELLNASPQPDDAQVFWHRLVVGLSGMVMKEE